LTPEAHARQSIGALLFAAGWGAENLQPTRIFAEFERHLSIAREVEAEVDANLQRAQALRQAMLQCAFAKG
jgi:hypothetical protein